MIVVLTAMQRMGLQALFWDAVSILNFRSLCLVPTRPNWASWPSMHPGTWGGDDHWRGVLISVLFFFPSFFLFRCGKHKKGGVREGDKMGWKRKEGGLEVGQRRG